MSLIFTPPWLRAVRDDDTLSPGALRTFYLSGTTTKANIYADGALTTPLANPIAADSSGMFVNVFLDPSLSYRVIETTSAGVAIADADPIAGADPQIAVAVAAETARATAAEGALDTRLVVAEGDIDVLQGTVTGGIEGYTTWAGLNAAYAAYNAGTTYSKGDTIRDQDAWWTYVNVSPGSGNAPPTLPVETSAYWRLISATPGGHLAQVPLSDGGVHTDPVVGGIVLNTGVFRWSVDPVGWERLYSTDAALAAPYVADSLANAIDSANSADLSEEFADLAASISLFDQTTAGAGSVDQGANGANATTTYYFPAFPFGRYISKIRMKCVAGGASPITFKHAALTGKTLATFVEDVTSQVMSSGWNDVDLDDYYIPPFHTLCFRRTAVGSATIAYDQRSVGVGLSEFLAGPASADLTTTQALSATFPYWAVELTWRRAIDGDDFMDRITALEDAYGGAPVNDTEYYFGTIDPVTPTGSSTTSTNIFGVRTAYSDRSGTLYRLRANIPTAGVQRIVFTTGGEGLARTDVAELYVYTASTGIVNFIAGVDFPAGIHLPKGARLGWQGVSGSSGWTTAYISAAGINTAGTINQTMWIGDTITEGSGANDVIFQMGFSIKAPAISVMPAIADIGDGHMRGRTKAVDQTFYSAAAPTGWAGPAWTFTTTGAQSPAAPADWLPSSRAVMQSTVNVGGVDVPAICYGRQRTARLVFRVNDTRARVGLFAASSEGGAADYGLSVNLEGTTSGAGAVVSLYRYNQLSAAPTKVGNSTTIPWTLSGGGRRMAIEWQIEWFKVRWKLIDLLTGQTVSGETNRFPDDGLYGIGQLGYMSGTGSGVANDATVEQCSLFIDVAKHFGVLMPGDSNLLAYRVSSSALGESMATLLNAARGRGDLYVSARGGAKADQTHAALALERAAGMTADYGIVYVSVNDWTTSQATWRVNFAALLAAMSAMCGKVYIGTAVPDTRDGGTHVAPVTAMNTDVLNYYFGRQYDIIDFGAAVSVSNARLAWVASQTIGDGNHLNLAGQRTCYERIALHAPELLPRLTGTGL